MRRLERRRQANGTMLPETVLWYNGRFWRDGRPNAEAVLVVGERIEAVGGADALRKTYRPTQERDLGGAWVYPGFRDPHAHLLYLGLTAAQIDLQSCRHPEDILAVLQQVDGPENASSWLLGKNLSDAGWRRREALNKRALDALFPKRPVVLSRVDRHAILVNSAALRLAGIDGVRPVKGGRIGSMSDRASSGYTGNPLEPDGWLVDEAMQPVMSLLPAPGADEQRAALLIAQQQCFAEGLTGVADMGLSLSNYRILEQLQKDGELLLPVYGTLTPDEKTEAHYRKHGPYFGERLTLRAFKYYADGALGSRGARLLEPYRDAPDHSGLWMHDPDYIREQALRNSQDGFQMVTHAIGDAAVRLVLDTVEYAAPHADHRWRVEHAQIVHPDDLPRFADLGAWASIQACHAVSDQHMAAERLGKDRLLHAYRGRSLLDAGARCVNGTDFPIEPVSPLRSFIAASCRVERGLQSALPFLPQEALSRREALLAMTRWAAEAQFQEKDHGCIEPGYYADFTVLDGDLLESPVESLADISVQETVVRGEAVFRKTT